MFLLNVKKAYFAMYASKDRSIEVIEVDYDEAFTLKMWESVKKTYFNIMLHTVCDKTCNNSFEIQAMEE